MRETICTIPVNEIFEERCGCPICTMRNRIEEKYIDYITGAAMMEPDIRQMTNKSGFCERHLNMMILSNRQRLPIALMLHTHLQYVEDHLLKKTDKGTVQKLGEMEESCFVCDYLNRHFDRHIDTLIKNYKNESEFRELFASQDYLCLTHYRLLAQRAMKPLGKMYAQFIDEANGLVMKKAEELDRDFKGFIDSFDYRNADNPMPEASKTVIERSIEFMTSRKAQKK